MPSQAQTRDSVTIHYQGSLADGLVFDCSRDRQPLTFELGAGQVMAALEAAVVGMAPGEVKRIQLRPDQAYGERRAELIFRVDRRQVPTHLPLEVGMQIQLPTVPDLPVMVVEIQGDRVVLDGNHPLAGEALTFEIELLQIGPARGE
ncbi:MAG: peptidylprolyl isomerase [Synechococcales cyanobacterium RM1_1_8]|nr:peptidylprolyl isomerase [Synechococcales cyanobacterium RM1_1_8]